MSLWTRVEGRLERDPNQAIGVGTEETPELVTDSTEAIMIFKGEFDGADPDRFEAFEAMWNIAKETQLSLTPVPSKWDTKQGRAGQLLLGLRGQAAVFAWRLSDNERKDDEKLMQCLKEKFLDKRSEVAYQREWSGIVQKDHEELDDFYERVKKTFNRAYKTLEIPENVKERFVAEKFRDSLVVDEVRIKLLEEGIVQDDGNAKTRAVVIAMAKRALALNDERNWNSKYRGDLNTCVVRDGTPWRKGKQKRESQQQFECSENWLCHYCRTRSHSGGWRSCARRQRENPEWFPRERPQRRRVPNYRKAAAAIDGESSSDECSMDRGCNKTSGAGERPRETHGGEFRKPDFPTA